jgi:hypothetical protein
VTTGEWGDKKNPLGGNGGEGDKEVNIINGVCVMNKSSDEADEDENMEKSNEDYDDEGKKNDENSEDEIKKSFIKKPSIEEGDDVRVKKEVEEPSGWEF